MHDILINGFIARINAGLMELEQVPIPYKDDVEDRINGE